MRWLLVAILVLGACRKDAAHDEPAPASGLVATPAIDEFRAGEKAVLTAFNDALHRQRANEIDELGLADAIDRQVLPALRELRAKLAAAQVPAPDRELFTTIDRYLGERESAWGAYAAALRSPDDAAAQPHYATYHAHEDAAKADALRIADAFRTLPR